VAVTCKSNPPPKANLNAWFGALLRKERQIRIPPVYLRFICAILDYSASIEILCWWVVKSATGIHRHTSLETFPFPRLTSVNFAWLRLRDVIHAAYRKHIILEETVKFAIPRSTDRLIRFLSGRKHNTSAEGLFANRSHDTPHHIQALQ
jgi:hypothetical protein